MSTPSVTSPPPLIVSSPAPGYGPPPMTMPGRVKAMRVVLFVLGGLNIAAGSVLLFGAVAVSTFGDSGDRGLAPLLYVLTAVVLLMATADITLGVRCARGGNRTRIAVIVVASLLAANYVISLYMGQALSAPGLAASIFLIAAGVSPDTKAWFNRSSR
ncbi:hypothetical protein ACFYZ9_33930 [Streptomyces sp. NPDC001691]|uniref:hypothetical protein n=1 Tax=Streptomyces sp. NPDC001691 TaxID=3364600 RepID=UPI003689CB8A